MKKVKIGFADFWKDFKPKNNIFTQLLEQKYEVELSENPDYLFYSVFGYDHLKYDTLRIFYTGETIIPDFNICDYGIGFNYMEFEDRYLRLPVYYLSTETYQKATEKHMQINRNMNERKFCNFVYSNSGANNNRELFYRMLSQYKTVDSGGRYLNNIGKPVTDKLEFQSGYKFSIAFENSCSRGYTTEKLIDAFAAGTIPIYWGNPYVYREFNEKAFINCHQYNSFEEVIGRVKEIDRDDSLFYSIISQPIHSKIESSIMNTNGIEKLADFLYAIFDKDIRDAARREATYHQIKYEERLKVIGKAHRFMRKIIPNSLLKDKLKSLLARSK